MSVAYPITDPGIIEIVTGSGVLWTVPVALGAGLFAMAFRSLRRRDRARGGPQFRAMGHDLGLNRGDLRLLAQLAQESGIPHPHALLLSEGLFEEASGGGGSDPRFDRLRRRIFSGTAESAPA